ncbi:IS200/IS605 family transposase [Streptomyces mirabilis]|uniref:IS200/IS605 family transposase n=1 Tax=Streptomyces mirabilis TaxID=68239 RepID=UPI003F4CD359
MVSTPKYRRGPFTGEILRRCEAVMRDVCAVFGAELHEFNDETDHMHLLVHCPPKIALSRLVGSLKASPRAACARNSSRSAALRSGNFWSPSHFAASCGGAPLSIIREYIENQKRPG